MQDYSGSLLIRGRTDTDLVKYGHRMWPGRNRNARDLSDYRRKQRPARPKLDPFVPVNDAIREADRHVQKKQRHTAKRIFERLRDEHGFAGGSTIVSDYVRESRHRTAEKIVPLHHPPGHASLTL